MADSQAHIFSNSPLIANIMSKLLKSAKKWIPKPCRLLLSKITDNT
jgi:hypothetical protein